MDLKKYEIIFTSFDAQFNFSRALLIQILCLNTFLLSKCRFKVNAEKKIWILSEPLCH